MRPLSTESLTTFPFFDSTTQVSLGGVIYFPQGTASTWQAEWRANSSPTMEVIVDWGDALISRSYTVNSVIRIETTLIQDATITGIADSMTAYKMVLLSGSGITDLRGTDRSTYASVERNVFAINARLKIEKISTDGSPDVVIYDKAVYEAFGSTTQGEGGGRTNDSAYAAELNQLGLIVYGKNFFMTQITGVASKTGQYRITFSLDPKATFGGVEVPNHIRIVNKRDTGAVVAPDGLSTYVVITVN